MKSTTQRSTTPTQSARGPLEDDLAWIMRKNSRSKGRRKIFVCFCETKHSSFYAINLHVRQTHPEAFKEYDCKIKPHLACTPHYSNKYDIYTLKQRVKQDTAEENQSNGTNEKIESDNYLSERYECFCGEQFLTMTGLAGYHFRLNHTELYRKHQMRLNRLRQTFQHPTYGYLIHKIVLPVQEPEVADEKEKVISRQYKSIDQGNETAVDQLTKIEKQGFQEEVRSTKARIKRLLKGIECRQKYVEESIKLEDSLTELCRSFSSIIYTVLHKIDVPNKKQTLVD